MFPSTPYRSAIDLTRSGRNVPLTDQQAHSPSEFSSLGIDVCHFATCSTLFFGHLSRDAQGMTKLGLRCQLARQFEALWEVAHLAGSKLAVDLGDALGTYSTTQHRIDRL